MLKRWYEVIVEPRWVFAPSVVESALESVSLTISSLLVDQNRARQRFGRAWGHFLARASQRSLSSLCLAELAAALVVLPYAAWLWVRPRPVRQRSTATQVHLKAERYLQVPMDLRSDDMQTIELADVVPYLTTRDLVFVLRGVWFLLIRARPGWKFQFTAKILKGVGTARSVIDGSNCADLFTYYDPDFANSVVTEFCNQLRVGHHGVMHGDRYLFCGTAFTAFNRLYVWNEFYADLFRRMRCEVDEFVVCQPPQFAYGLREPRLDAAGVLLPSTCSDPEHLRWRALVGRLACRFQTVELRCHPRFEQRADDWLDGMPINVKLSRPSTEDVPTFLERLGTVIGEPSTVLIEAAMNGRAVTVIDSEIVRQVSTYHFMYRLPKVSVHSLEEICVS